MVEHLWLGILGEFLIVLFFIASLLGVFLYFRVSKDPSNSADRTIARIAIVLQFASVIGVFALLIIAFINHYYEYYYVYQHSSNELIFKYLFSSIWEGQEGSFLVWMFWNSLVSIIIVQFFKKSEAYVLWVMCIIQAWLGSMVLGVYIGDLKIGSDPFILLKHVFQDAPIFQTDNYLSFIKDGQGLNVLLQNYWMVIHPPVLFLGFSLSSIPFCYMISQLYIPTFDMERYKKRVMQWAILATVFLGVGIGMGAAWAYESLTFGGYWAWDPVENASLVPWLILIAGFHSNAIYNSTQKGKHYVIVLYLLSFLFVIYSTFLTRSGVLGNSSVHSFTDLGMNNQLLSFLLFFVLFAFLPYLKKSNRLRKREVAQEEENYLTREFFLLVGTLLFLFASLIIIGKTSLPIVNLIFGTNYSQPEDAVHSYNQSVIILMSIALLGSSFSLYLSYKKTKRSKWLKPLIVTLLSSVVFFVAVLLSSDGFFYDKYGIIFAVFILILLFASCYALCSNLWYIYIIKPKKILKIATPLSHFGFGLLVFGILFSSAKKEILSINTSGFSPLKIGDSEAPAENITLLKNVPKEITSYSVTFQDKYYDSILNKTFFNIVFQPKNDDEQFTLKPDIIQNNKGQEGLTPNPDVKHYWNEDVFAYITYIQIKEDKDDPFEKSDLNIGDTMFFSKGFFILKDVKTPQNSKTLHSLELDTAVLASIETQYLDGKKQYSNPILYVKNGQMKSITDTTKTGDIVYRIDKIVDNHTFQISYLENNNSPDFITLKIYKFPHISLVWIGAILMFIGMIFAVLRKRL